MDRIKELFKGERGKWMIAGIIGVVVLALYMRSRSGRSNEFAMASYPSMREPSGQTESGDSGTRQEMQNMIGSMYRDLGQQLEAQSESQQRIAEQFASSLAGTQTAFSQMFGNLQDMFDSQIGGLQSQLDARVQQDMIDYAARESSSGYSSIVTYDPPQQTMTDHAPVSAVTGRVVSTRNVFGAGGIDYNTATAAQRRQMEENTRRLETDASYRQSEIQRAQQVIQNRSAWGLSTAEQEKYLRQLTG